MRLLQSLRSFAMTRAGIFDEAINPNPDKPEPKLGAKTKKKIESGTQELTKVKIKYS